MLKNGTRHQNILQYHVRSRVRISAAHAVGSQESQEVHIYGTPILIDDHTDGPLTELHQHFHFIPRSLTFVAFILPHHTTCNF